MTKHPSIRAVLALRRPLNRGGVRACAGSACSQRSSTRGRHRPMPGLNCTHSLRIASVASQQGASVVGRDGRTQKWDTFALRRPAVRRFRVGCQGQIKSPGATAGMYAEASRSQLAAALARVAAGDRAALRLVYGDTSAKLFGVCLRILNDKSEAEDVLQDVFVTVWRKAASFDPARASPITWLVAIARNRAIDRLRASAMTRRTEPIEAADAVGDPAPAAVERIELAQQHQRLAHCLEELEARQSAAIRAAFLDGATYEELAQRMSVPLGTMKSWIRRGLLKLRTCLEE